MKIDFLEIKSTWREVADAARTTIGMEKGVKEPSSAWKQKMLLAEHSPIRQLIIKWKWVDLKSWVSVHFVRHKIGIEHFVRTQRTDRTGKNREEILQSAKVNHECIANAQAIINISRRRLCNQAALDTQKAWKLFLNKLKEKEPELFNSCVPDCIYRGMCFEIKSCNYDKTLDFYEKLANYRIINLN